MKAVSKKLYMAMFVAVLCLPLPCWALFGKFMDTVNYENRDWYTYGSCAAKPARSASIS